MVSAQFFPGPLNTENKEVIVNSSRVDESGLNIISLNSRTPPPSSPKLCNDALVDAAVGNGAPAAAAPGLLPALSAFLAATPPLAVPLVHEWRRLHYELQVYRRREIKYGKQLEVKLRTKGASPPPPYSPLSPSVDYRSAWMEDLPKLHEDERELVTWATGALTSQHAESTHMSNMPCNTHFHRSGQRGEPGTST